MIAILAGLLVPAIQKMRDSSRIRLSQNNLREMTLATIDTADRNNGRLPPYWGWYPRPNGPEPGNGYGGVFWHILPQMGHADLYRSGTDEADDTLYRADIGSWEAKRVRTYYSPGDPTADVRTNRVSYAANLRAFSQFDQWGWGPN